MHTLKGKNILSITQKGILYRDINDEVQWLELAECNQNYCDTRRNLIEPDFDTVGKHHIFPNYIELFTEPPLRFDFEDGFAEEPEKRDERFLQVVNLFEHWFLRYEVHPDGH